jgi:hypothetical protein
VLLYCNKLTDNTENLSVIYWLTNCLRWTVLIIPKFYVWVPMWRAPIFGDKCKNKDVPVLNYALCHEDVWESGGIIPPFFVSALDGGAWSVSRPGRFTPRGKRPRYPLDMRLCVPQNLDAMRYRKVSCPCGNRTPAVEPIARLYTDWNRLFLFTGTDSCIHKYRILIKSVQKLARCTDGQTHSRTPPPLYSEVLKHVYPSISRYRIFNFLILGILQSKRLRN